MTSSVNWIYIVNHLDVSVNKQLYSNYMIITPTGFRIVLRAKLDGSNRFYTRMQI